MISEVFNTDCLEYMRTLPDKAFELAIADPPYGGAGNDISGANEIRNQSSRIAAYKMGFDYVGCELDKEYFAKGCERFDRECRGITVSETGTRYRQTSIFDNNQV